MNEDKSDDPSGQESRKSQNLTESLFGPYLDQCWVTAGVQGDKQSWVGHFYKRDRVDAFDPMRGHYFSIALIKKGATTRSAFDAGILIVADDVGYVAPVGATPISPGARVDIEEFRLFAPETSYEVETSHGNFQMGFRIEPPERDFARWHHFIMQAKQHPRFGKAFADCTVVHYYRMETGSNQPKPNRPRFKSRLIKPFTGKTYTFDELAAELGIDMIKSQVWQQTPVAGGETLSLDSLKKLLELLPNNAAANFSYDLWVRVGLAIYGATGGSLEGLELYEWWSQQSPKYALTPAETPDHKWDSFYNTKSSATTLRRIIEEVYGAGSDERAAASQLFAPEAFEAIPDAEGIAAAPETEEKLDADLNALLAEIRKLQPVPPHHDVIEDRNWLDAKGGLRGLGSIIAAEGLTAPPVVYEPYARGILSTIAGLPGKGKSILVLQQSLAVACDRGDLIRTGLKLQFPGDVLFFSNEDGLNVMKRRAAAWSQRHGVTLDKPHRVIPLRSNLLRKEGETWKVECLRVLKAILAELKARPGDVSMIVIDTLTQSISGAEENSARDMPFVMKFMDRLASAFWGAVIFVTHVNKASAGAEERSITWIRGSISIGGAVRAGVLLVGPTQKEKEEFAGVVTDETVVEYIVKATDGRDGFVASFYRRVFEVVDVRDAVDPTKTIPFTMMLLEPFYPVPVTGDLAQLKNLFDTLKRACVMGEVRVPAASAKTAGGNSVHHVFNTTIKKAVEIVEVMRDHKWIEIVEKHHRNGDYRVVKII